MVVDHHQKRMRGETAPTHYEFRALTKDGNARWVNANTVGIEWEGRLATLGLLSDITERKKAEQETAAKVAAIEKLNEIMFGREKRIVEVKREVNALLKELGREWKYGV